MRRAEAGAGIALEICVEPIEIAVVIRAERVTAGTFERSLAISVAKPKTNQAIRYFVRDFVQLQVAPGTSRAFDFEIVAVVVMKFLKRLDEQIIDRQPDRAAPIRVAAENICLRFGRIVADGTLAIFPMKNVG